MWSCHSVVAMLCQSGMLLQPVVEVSRQRQFQKKLNWTQNLQSWKTASQFFASALCGNTLSQLCMFQNN